MAHRKMGSRQDRREPVRLDNNAHLPFPETLELLPISTGVRVASAKQPPGKGFPMRQTGTVKFFNTSKGFGFITPDGGAKDVFVHVSALEKSGITHLQDGQKVSFDTEPDRQGKGPKAVNLQLA
jgi:CspA family cold shock protein